MIYVLVGRPMSYGSNIYASKFKLINHKIGLQPIQIIHKHKSTNLLHNLPSYTDLIIIFYLSVKTNSVEESLILE